MEDIPFLTNLGKEKRLTGTASHGWAKEEA